MALRPTRANPDDVEAPDKGRILKRTKVLTTAMADDAPAAKKRVIKKAVTKTPAKKTPAKKTSAKKTSAKKKATTRKPVVKAIAADASAVDIDDERQSASIWNEPRDPRQPRRSATERLNDPPPADGPLLVARVANAIERELTQIEIIVGNNRVPPRERTEAERRARTLASLARTLSLVTKLRETNLPRPDDDDEHALPRDLDELRDALARRLERLVAGSPQSPAGESDAG